MTDDKKLSTLPLDDAMKELLDLFNQCDEKSTQPKLPHSNIDALESLGSHSRIGPSVESADVKMSQTREHGCSAAFRGSSNQNAARGQNSKRYDGSETIEKLQQEQSALQNQLDEVLKVSNELELKQKRKLNGLVKGNRSEQQSESDDGDDDDIELIEFHQIEIELRISELNRQLSSIQEEIRLRLYKRLQSRTSGGHLTSAPVEQHISSRDPSLRRNSTQTDESTPPSSSCSDETNATSSADLITHSSTKNSIESDLSSQFEKCNLSKPALEFTSRTQQAIKFNHGDLVEGNQPNNNARKETKEIDLQSASNQNHNYEVIVPATSDTHKKTNNAPLNLPSRIPTMSNFNRCTNNNNDNATQQQRLSSSSHEVSASGADTQMASNGYRSCHMNNDLERIEEGEEDDFDYYCNSEKFRSIYEEKICPIIQAAETDSHRSTWGNNQQQKTDEQNPSIRSRVDDKTSDYATPRPSQDNRFNINNVNSSKRGNRPLTIYLPRPDEDLDLVETVQLLGHDLNILSSDLKITATSAEGYLYKSCSNNSKKWLKRYFLFNRKSKTLSYYESEEQLVKKTTSPKCTVSFEEISDVYVDHRLSEKQKGATRNSYVFVLATIKRKYLLASSKAETMRAWIDILFTAAKANDYFQQLENNGESLSFNYDSFQED